MIEKEFITQSDSSLPLIGKVIEPTPIEETKAIILICHGMAEHIGRYDSFMSFLTNHSYICVAYDQRGHGKTAGSVDKCGYMDDVDNFEALVQDLHTVFLHIKHDYPKYPVILFGHSMGSFVSERYVQLYGDTLDGVILSGSSLNKGFYYSFARKLTSIITKMKGRTYKSPFVHHSSFTSFNKKFRPNTTSVDWLSKDMENNKAYEKDEYCGNVFSVSYYKDLTNGFKTILDNFELVPNLLPIYIMSGQEDPVGKFSKGPIALQKKYLHVGVHDVSLKLYPTGRHEMLNETNKDEVYQDILTWLDNHANTK